MLRVALIIAFTAVAGCDPAPDDGLDDVSFLDAVAQAAPSFDPAEGQALILEQALELPAPVKAIFDLLRSPRGDNVDATNMYSVLEEADRARNSPSGCTAFEAHVVDSPFDFGLDESYTCGRNGTNGDGSVALREDGDVHHVLTAVKVDAADQTAVLAVQASLDDSSGHVAVEMAEVVRYPQVTATTGLGFGLRTSIAGDAIAHEFTARALVRNVEDETPLTTSITAAGNSKNPSEHFLLRVTAEGNGTDFEGRYYCLPGGADETTLSSLDPAGTIDPAPECASLRTSVDALVPFVRADAPDELTDFTADAPHLDL